MKTTLIITTYNNPAYLSKVLECMTNQKRMPDEVVIADDGSGPDTAQVVRAFSSDAPFPVLHVWHEHKGFRAAKIRNEAIKKSSGDYIILLDGDCLVNKYFIEDHLRLAEDRNFIQGKRVLAKKDIASSINYQTISSSYLMLKLIVAGMFSNMHHLIRLPFFPPLRNKKINGIKTCNMGFFKKDVVAVNGFNEEFTGWGNEDTELAVRFYNYGLTRKEHPFMGICFHLWHETNNMLNNSNIRLLTASIESGEYFCKDGLFKKN